MTNTWLGARAAARGALGTALLGTSALLGCSDETLVSPCDPSAAACAGSSQTPAKRSSDGSGGVAAKPPADAADSLVPTAVPSQPGPAFPDEPVAPLCETDTVVRHSLTVATQAHVDALANCERIEGSLDLRWLPGVLRLEGLQAITEITGTLSTAGGSLSRGQTPGLIALRTVGSLVLRNVAVDSLQQILPRLSRIGTGASADDGVVSVSSTPLAGLAAFGPIRRLDLGNFYDSALLSDLGPAQIEEIRAELVSFANLEWLGAVQGLRALTILGNDALTSLRGLKDGTALESLSLAAGPGLTDLTGLPPTPALRELQVAATLQSFNGLVPPEELQALTIGSFGPVAQHPIDVSALSGVRRVGRLTLVGVNVPLSAFRLERLGALALAQYPLADLSGLETVRGLQSLRVAPLGPFQLAGLTDASELRELILSNVATLFPVVLPARMARVSLDGLQDLRGLEQLTDVTELSLTTPNLTDLAGLSALQTVQRLQVGGGELVDVSALARISGLESLSIGPSRRLTTLPTFDSVERLERLTIRGNDRLSAGPAFPRLQTVTLLEASENDVLQILGAFPVLRFVRELLLGDNRNLRSLGVSALERAPDLARIATSPALTAEALAPLSAVSAKLSIDAVGPLRPCPWPDDGVCDERAGVCALGSDPDCRIVVGEPLIGRGQPLAPDSDSLLLPRWGLPASGQIVSPDAFARRCIDASHYPWGAPGCAPLDEVLASPECAFVTRGCGFTRVESSGGSAVRWYRDWGTPVGLLYRSESIVATESVACEEIEASCNTCGQHEPFCTSSVFPELPTLPTFSAIAQAPESASDCACEPDGPNTSRVSLACFCAVFGCPTSLALTSTCLDTPPALAERVCNQVEVQQGTLSSERFAFDAATGNLLGAEAVRLAPGLLPCSGSRLVAGEPLLGRRPAPSQQFSTPLTPLSTPSPPECAATRRCTCTDVDGPLCGLPAL